MGKDSLEKADLFLFCGRIFRVRCNAFVHRMNVLHFLRAAA